MNGGLLQINDLCVEFRNPGSTTYVLDSVCCDVRKGEILGLVGESGCGKSVMARSILRLLPTPPAFVSGEVFFEGEDLFKASKKKMRAVRGNEISMIFQEPMTSLNPVFSVGAQMSEVVCLHKGCSRKEARSICIDMLRLVKMPDPEQCFDKFPHELSGGMRQRVMIAMELSCDPKLLIADEPTTALDVTVQGQVLAKLYELTHDRGVSTLFITHDMGVVAQICDRVAVMYAGRIVEMVDTHRLFREPLHPYTQGLIAAIPSLEGKAGTLSTIPGSVPSLKEKAKGCRFAPRCSRCLPRCLDEAPKFRDVGGRFVACHQPG